MKLKLFFFFINTMILFAQEIEFNRSGYFKDLNGINRLEFVVSINEFEFITIRSFHDIDTYLITKYNSDLKVLDEIKYKNNKTKLISAIILNDKLTIIGVESKNNNASNSIETYEYFSLETDVSKLSLNKKLFFSISEKNLNNFFNSYNKFGSNDFSEKIFYSDNFEYFSLYFSIKNKNMENIGLINFNSSLKMNYSAIIGTNNDLDNITLEDILVDNEGSTYILANNITKKTSFSNKFLYYSELKCYSKNNFSTYNLSQHDLNLSSFKLMKKGDILSLIGLYSEESNLNFKGIFRINFKNIALERTEFMFNELNEQFIIDKLGSVEKYKNSFNNKLFAGECIWLDDDSIIYIAEENSVGGTFISSSVGVGGTSTSPSFASDLSIFKLDKEGDLVWGRNINKSQKKNYYETYSYKLLFNKSDIHLLINASNELNNDINKEIKLTGDAAFNLNLFDVKIKNNGEIQYKILIDQNNINTPLILKRGKYLNKFHNLIVLSTLKKNKKTELFKFELN